MEKEVEYQITATNDVDLTLAIISPKLIAAGIRPSSMRGLLRGVELFFEHFDDILRWDLGRARNKLWRADQLIPLVPDLSHFLEDWRNRAIRVDDSGRVAPLQRIEIDADLWRRRLPFRVNPYRPVIKGALPLMPYHRDAFKDEPDL